jgi:ABC-type Zn2+ transport system substrate-binding protein/surface adhesin
MDVDPLEFVDSDDEESPEEAERAAARRDRADARKEKEKSRLNALVAVTVAVLATFMSICNVKDGNIVQNMQQAQAKSIDTWAWYQARKIRIEVANAAAAQLRAERAAAPRSARDRFEKAAADFEKSAAEQNDKLKQTQAEAQSYDKSYDAYNFHDDQFDAAEAFLSLAITLLALTSLTQKRWLYWGAMVPTALGLLMGFSGLTASRLHWDWLARLLS